MTAQLVYDHDGRRQVYVLDRDEITIGRTPDNDLVIPDTSISRHHAKLYKRDTAWRVMDLGSKNGTHVNDIGNAGGDLKDGDEIILGKFPIRFHLGVPENVALTEAPKTGQDEIAGTMFRSAVDFSFLASSSPHPTSPQGAAEIDRMRRLLTIVTKVSEALLASKPLDETLQSVLDLVFDHLPVERGFVMLWDEQKQDLVPRAVKQRGLAAGEIPKITVSRTIAEKVYRDKVSILTTDAQHDARFAGGASILALGIRSAMAAPLWNGDKVDGIIYVDTPLHVKAFDDFDLDLLSALGNHAAIAIEQARLQEGILQERLSRQRLERYHSPAVIDRIQRAGQEGESFTVDEREVTVLFADVVGFTSRCERMEPREVAELLNRCFSRMSDAIFKWEGTLDKFIGDCVMAVFGAPLEMDDHAMRAVEVALEMRKALQEVNEALPEGERVQFRVGMNSGKVVAGDIGSVRRSDYTVLGATVNLASRLEGLAKPGQILISDSTEAELGGRFDVRFVTEAQPKGISRMVKCYEVIGYKSSAERTVAAT